MDIGARVATAAGPRLLDPESVTTSVTPESIRPRERKKPFSWGGPLRTVMTRLVVRPPPGKVH